MLCPRPSDPEIDANLAAWAAELLDYPLAPTLPKSTRHELAAIRAGARPPGAAGVFRLAWVALDAEAIRLSVGAQP